MKKSNKKIKKFIVNCQVYPYDIFCFFGEDISQLKKELSKLLPKTDIDDFDSLIFSGTGKSVMFPNNQTLLWLKYEPHEPILLGTLNHEIFHCACFILERAGIKYCEDSDEAYAYLIAYLTGVIYSKLNIFNKKK